MEVPVGEDKQVIERSVWEKRKEKKEKKIRNEGWPAKDKSKWVRCVVGINVLGGARVVPKKSDHYFFFSFDLLGCYIFSPIEPEKILNLVTFMYIMTYEIMYAQLLKLDFGWRTFFEAW